MSKTKGMFWHVHHDQLLEYCYGYGERVRCIKENKPKDERELRLRLFQLVKGKLPVAVIKARTAYDKAQTAYIKARTAYIKAQTAYDKALQNNVVAIEKLHRKECQSCPWDGKTIFRKGEK